MRTAPLEPITPIVAARGMTVLAEHLLCAVRLDLRDRHIRPTASAVRAYAAATGLPPAIADDLAALVEASEGADVIADAA